MSKASRDKGANAEREIVNILKDRGYDARRSFSQIGGDRPDVTGLPGFGIEVKRQERLELWAALDQAAKAAGTDTPLLIFRRSRSEWQAAIPLTDLLDLLERVK